MRVVIDQYYYKQRLYTDLGLLIDALKANGHVVDPASIPSNVGWQKRFWNELDVHWEQIEVEQDDKIIKAARDQAKVVINRWITLAENGDDSGTVKKYSLKNLNRYQILAKYESQYDELVRQQQKYFYDLYKWQVDLNNQIDACLTTEQIKMVLEPFINEIQQKIADNK